MHVENVKGELDKPLKFDVETHYIPKNERTAGVTLKSHISLSLDGTAAGQQETQATSEEVEEENPDNQRVPLERSLTVIPKTSKEVAIIDKNNTRVAAAAKKEDIKEERKSLDDYFDIFDDDAERAKQQGEKSATISDVERIYKEKAEHEAEELLRKEYEAIGGIKFLTPSTWKTWTRMKMYWMRGERRNKSIKSAMQMYKDKQVDLQHSEVTSAADRHEKMFMNWNDDNSIIKVADGINLPEVDALCKAYLLNASLTDAQFEKQFNAIVAKNPSVKKALKKNVDYSASNILLKLRAEKQYRVLINNIGNAVQSYAAKPDAAVYTSTVKNYVDAYVSATHT